MTLIQQLSYLVKKGCYPGLYRRGKLWRAHVNCSGNFWADDKTPTKAFHWAIKMWKSKGCPMDGMAARDLEEKV